MANQLFTNVKIFDGSGKAPFPGEVLVQGNRIKTVAKGRDQFARDGASVVDGDGATLMPGMVNCHSHISYTDVLNVTDLGDTPPEEHILQTLGIAQRVFDCGFTALIGAASAKPRLDLVVRNEINSGRVEGPRLRAASPAFASTAALGDTRQLHMHHQSFEILCDGPDEFRRNVREMIREGVDIIKLNISGDDVGAQLSGAAHSAMNTCSEDEVAAAAEVAHSRGKWMCAHARSTDSVRWCLKYGVQLIHHATFADEKTLDALEAKKNEHWVCPAFGFIYVSANEAQDYGMTEDVVRLGGFNAELEVVYSTMRKMHKRGIRVLPFGDYGFVYNPHGTDARELEHFVNLLGFSPADTLKAATKYGGEAFAMGGTPELGMVKQGFLADLIMVDGDPLADITLLQDNDKILMIMKDGSYRRRPQKRRGGARERRAG